MSHPYPSELLNDIIKCAKEAGRIAMKYRRDPSLLEITVKGDTSKGSNQVTAAEPLMEKLYLKLVEKYGGSFLGEECGKIPAVKNPEIEWKVDPIDGTTNCANGAVAGGYAANPLTCTSAGADKNGKPYAGVVHNFVTGETFFAQEGLGAFVETREGEIIRLTVTTTPIENITRPTIHYGHFSDKMASVEPIVLSKFHQWANHIGKRSTDKSLGCTALELCFVATTNAQATFGTAYEWDYTAARVIATEAGYKFHIKKDEGYGPHLVIAAHPDIFEMLVKESELARYGARSIPLGRTGNTIV